MMHLLVSLVALFALAHSAQVQYSCIDLSGEVKQCPQNSRPSSFGDHLVAFAKYAKRINETGWDELELVTNEHLPDEEQAYWAGWLEGYVTAGLIKSLRHNMLQEDKKQWCTKLGHFITENLKHTIAEVHQKKNDSYWHEVGLTLYQVAGMDDGSAMAESGKGHKKPHLDLNPCGNILMNLYTEFSEMLSIMKTSQVEERETRCSAIIKYLPQKGEVYVAHNTWSNFYTMIRIMKKYTLNFKTSQAKSVAMSSYPGNVFSTDDYYITSQNMVVQETSITNFNSSMWNGLNATNFVFEFIRNTVANRLATSGAEWAAVFSRLNSGTYNNQFMIVDYKRLVNKTILPGLLTVLEQMPNLIVHADMSEHLKEHTYWPSYNVPFFKQVYSESGNEQMAQKDDFYSYHKTARALIFARDHHKVENISSLYHLMRYNDMFHDPLSRCNCTPPYTGEFAIAARCDLNDPHGTYPISAFSFRPHGAIDAKMTSAELAKKLQMVAVSGPTDEGVPAFSWATTRLHGIPHLDEPIEWKFKPLRTTWNNTHDVFPNFNYDF